MKGRMTLIVRNGYQWSTRIEGCRFRNAWWLIKSAIVLLIFGSVLMHADNKPMGLE